MALLMISPQMISSPHVILPVDIPAVLPHEHCLPTADPALSVLWVLIA